MLPVAVILVNFILVLVWVLYSRVGDESASPVEAQLPEEINNAD